MRSELRKSGLLIIFNAKWLIEICLKMLKMLKNVYSWSIQLWNSQYHVCVNIIVRYLSVPYFKKNTSLSVPYLKKTLHSSGTLYLNLILVSFILASFLIFRESKKMIYKSKIYWNSFKNYNVNYMLVDLDWVFENQRSRCNTILTHLRYIDRNGSRYCSTV